MAVTIIPGNAKAPGSEIDEILGSGIQNLANLKVQQLQQRHQRAQTAHGLTSALNISPDKAYGLAGLPPETLKYAMQNIQQQAANEELDKILGQVGGDGQPQGTGSSQAGSNFSEILKRSNLKPDQRLKVAELEQRRSLAERKQSIAERKQQHAEEQAERKQSVAERKQQHTEEQETLPYYRKLQESAQASNDGDKRLNRMETLVKKGSLPIAAFYKLFKNLAEGETGLKGVPIIGGLLSAVTQPIGLALQGIQKGITSTDTEEFEKLSNDFVKDAKSFFGNRLTDTDLKFFMQSVPTLSNTDAGKLKIIENMKSFNEASRLKWKAAQDILKENKGKRPANLEILVEERTKPQIDLLAQKFIEGL